MAYFSGQGKVYVGTRNADGSAAGFRYLGNVPELSIKPATTKVEHKEATSGNRLVDQVIQTEKNVNCSFSVEEFSADNLAMLLYGTKTSTTGASVTNEAITGAVAGDYIRTKYPDISSLVMGSKVAGTDYVLTNAKTGLIQLITAPNATMNYTYATHTHVPMMSQQYTERWLRFEGLNMADVSSGVAKQVLVELYRVVLDPPKDIPLIQDNIAKFDVEGNVMYDSLKSADTYLGQFGRIVVF